MAVTDQDALGALVTELHLLGGTASRAELTGRLGRGRSVIGYLLGELTERGLITIDRTGDRAVPAARGRGTGRPPHPGPGAATAPAVVAVHLNVDTVTVATVALGGRVLRRAEHALTAGTDLDHL